MGRHHIEHDVSIRQLIKLKITEHALQDDDPFVYVGFHHRPFGWRQRAWLEQDPVRDADLADVVQGRKQIKMLDVFIGQSTVALEMLGNQTGVVGHPLKMPTGFEIPECRKLPGDMGRRCHGSHQTHVSTDGHAHQHREDRQVFLHPRRECRWSTGVVEENTDEFSAVKQRHRERRLVTLIKQPEGMAVHGLHHLLDRIENPRLTCGRHAAE